MLRLRTSLVRTGQSIGMQRALVMSYRLGTNPTALGIAVKPLLLQTQLFSSWGCRQGPVGGIHWRKIDSTTIRLLSTTPEPKKFDDATSSSPPPAAKKEGKKEEKKPVTPQYWRDDYETNFTMEELLKKQKDMNEKEARESYAERALEAIKNGSVAVGNIVINFSKGTISLIVNPRRIPGAALDLWKTIKHEAYHYWIGFKLMGRNIFTAISILNTALNGKRLTRRERRMLRRVAVDIFRLVPFSIFIIIPFMEVLLPVALRLFPNMLPSSFHSKHEKEDKMKKELQARLQMASFLQETVDELVKTKLEDEEEKKKVVNLLDSVRKGQRISNEDLLKVTSVFSDELTLENMPRAQLVSLCQYMGLRPFGSNPNLRWHLSQEMQKIKEDDQLINDEGVESLTIDELRTALQERGMRTVGLTMEGYRRNLNQWLNLSLHENVPISLLVLSRAFTILERTKPTEQAIQETISAMDDDMVEEVLAAAGIEDDVAKKLEVLERQHELMMEESEERAQREERRRKIQEAKLAMEAEKEAEKAAEEKVEEKTIQGREKLVAELVRHVRDDEVMEDLKPDTKSQVKVSDKVLEEAVEDLEALVKNQAVEEERDFLEALKSEVAEKLEEEVTLSNKHTDELREGVQAEVDSISRKFADKTVDHIQEVIEDKLKSAQEGDSLVQEEEEKLKTMKSQSDYVADRLKGRVAKMLEDIEMRIEEADKKMDSLRVLDIDGDGVITEAELVTAIKEVLAEHNTEEEAQAIAKEVLARAADKLNIGVSTQQLIQLSKELRSRNFKPSKENVGEGETPAEDVDVSDKAKS
uniref:Mitochondrial proton/calcium exchanger protein n=1 Tax=Amorphochlora amoebiformis TaxID=1561963 RepID=A0A7S0H6B0_9EUKA|mmetsp:Transcript_7403/g.11468  ORF Transcript_7403/g.11468 Transcript_7403/m.11468 type:complete len:813 (+) Transcript_7403:94-2532(+)